MPPRPTRPTRPPITPLTLSRRVRTVLVFGGSFDPPHSYHTVAPLTAQNLLCGDRGYLLYIPAAQSPHKTRAPRASQADRLAMLHLAIGDRRLNTIMGVWTDELDRARPGEPSYTIDTLRRLRRILPDHVELRLLIGMDQAFAFHRWKSPRAIIKLAEPLVMARPPYLTAFDLASELDRTGFWTRPEIAAWCRRLAPNLIHHHSSTDVRGAIPGAPADPDRWADKDGLRYVPREVAAYIIEHNLYGFRPTPARTKKKPPARAGGR